MVIAAARHHHAAGQETKKKMSASAVAIAAAAVNRLATVEVVAKIRWQSGTATAMALATTLRLVITATTAIEFVAPLEKVYVSLLELRICPKLYQVC